MAAVDFVLDLKGLFGCGVLLFVFDNGLGSEGVTLLELFGRGLEGLLGWLAFVSGDIL